MTSRSNLITPHVDHEDVAILEFDSVNQLVRSAFARGEGNSAHACSTADEMMERCNSWTNNCHKHDVMKAMKTAPTYLIQEVERMQNAIEDNVKAPVRPRRARRRFQPVGDELSEDAWIRRDPNGWTDTTKEHVYKHVVSMGVNLVTPWHFDQSKLTYRGALVAALADCFTTLGHSVMVDLVYTSRGTCSAYDRTAVIVTVKHPDSPLDIASLSYTTGDIAFSRLGVLCAEVRNCKGTIDYGCGQVCPIPSHLRDRYDMIFDLDILDFDRAVNRAKIELDEIQQKDSRLTVNKR